MIDALNGDDLRIEQDQETGDFYAISTQQFSTEHDVTVRVELEPASEKPGLSGHH